MEDIMEYKTKFREMPKAIGYLSHKPTHNQIAIYHHIGWFKRIMIKVCFGLVYEKAIDM